MDNKEVYIIYILELSTGKYYVGKTKNLDNRLEDHFASQTKLDDLVDRSSMWCRKYHPVSLLVCYENCDAYDEDKYVKIYMAKYGIDNVRGGSYSQIILSPEQKVLLEREIRGANDYCFNCGMQGHFISLCPSKHNSESKRRITDVEDEVLDDFTVLEVDRNNPDKNKPDENTQPTFVQYWIDTLWGKNTQQTCSRCGRNNHAKRSCYAKRHINGRRLSF
jgi:predicted GIY-YIG superfamily endonuclease